VAQAVADPDTSDQLPVVQELEPVLVQSLPLVAVRYPGSGRQL